MSDGQDVKDSVNSLMEEFTEMEADLPEDVYKALAPHIKKVSDGLTGAFDNLARLNRMSELVTILSTGKFDLTDVDIETFRRASRGDAGDSIVIEFKVKHEDPPQEEQDGGVILLRPVAYDAVRRHHQITDDEARGIRLGRSIRGAGLEHADLMEILERLRRYRRVMEPVRDVPQQVNEAPLRFQNMEVNPDAMQQLVRAIDVGERQWQVRPQ